MKTHAIMSLAALTLLACEPTTPAATATEAATSSAAAATEPGAPADDAAEPGAPAEPAAPAAAQADPSAWPETFGGPDPFDEASGEVENEEGDPSSATKIVSGLERMTAKDTRAALDTIKPALAALRLKEEQAKADWPMPSYDGLIDPTRYTTRAYPVGPDAVFVLAREANSDQDSEHEVPKAALLYDAKSGEIAYHLGLHDWKRWDRFSKHEVGGVAMMRVGHDSEGGQCAAGGTVELFAALPGGVKRVLEREWDLTSHARATSVAVLESGVVKVTSQPAVKKNKKKETFVTDKVEETCRFSNGEFTCVKKVVEEGVVTPGCF